MNSEKTRKIKQAKGITLLALVITIVILIILALVAISFAFGENGVVKYADKAKLDAEIDSARERLSLVLGSAYTEKKTSTKYESEEEFLDNHLEEYVYGREPDANIERDEEDGNKISLNGHVFELDRSVPQLGDYIGPEGNLPARIRSIKRVETDNTYSELSIEVTAARAEGATYRYSYKKEGEEYNSPEERSENTYIFTNLESQLKYWIKVELVMNGEVVDTKEEPMILGLLEEGNLKFGEVTWSEGKASITVSTTTNNQIQYKIISDEGEATDWTNISNNGTISNISNKSTVLARLWDRKNGSEEISRTILDSIAPVITSFEVTEITWNSIEVEVEAVDNESGIASTNTYKFYLNDEMEERESNTDGKYKFDGLTISDSEISYKIRVEAYDNVGNKSEAILQNVNTKAAIMKIYTKEDMEGFRDIVNSGFTYEDYTVEIMNDIDLECNEENQWTPIGNESRYFKGTLNGNEHIINNLYINTTLNYQALFGKNSGTIKNIIVMGEIKGESYNLAGIVGENLGEIENCINYVNVLNNSISNNKTGGICGSMTNGRVKNSVNYGIIKSKNDHVGGISGFASGTDFSISDCKNYGNISGKSSSGGILGGTKITGNIEKCINEADISAIETVGAGGIIGTYENKNINELLTINSCSNEGMIYAKTWAAGGILGNNIGYVKILKCKNLGEIYGGNGNCGGIVGSIGQNDETIFTSNIDECFNTGYIHALGTSGNPSVGGIAGTVQFGDNIVINNCYNSGKIASTKYTSGNTYGTGGIVGSIYNNSTITSTKSKVTIGNSYNIGNIENSYSSLYAGQIIGKDFNNNRVVTNCYYLNTASGMNTYGGVASTDINLKKYAKELGDTYWKTDEYNLNNGYPILRWQIEE